MQCTSCLVFSLDFQNASMFRFSDWTGLFSSSPKALYESQQCQRANLVYRSCRTFQVIINSKIFLRTEKKHSYLLVRKKSPSYLQKQ